MGFVVMLKSAFMNSKGRYLPLIALAAGLTGYSFSWYTDRQQALLWASKCLLQAFDATGDPKLKKWDLTLTPDAFIRFKRTYQGGKQEYYSFNLHRFKDLNYLGTTTKGMLCFKTQADDVIVQTFNDPKGNIDSMSTTLKIPLKNVEAEQLDSLLNAITYLKTQ